MNVLPIIVVAVYAGLAVGALSTDSVVIRRSLIAAILVSAVFVSYFADTAIAHSQVAGAGVVVKDDCRQEWMISNDFAHRRFHWHLVVMLVSNAALAAIALGWRGKGRR